jgi:hypothetical protein
MLLGAFYVFGQARSDSDLLLIIGTLQRVQLSHAREQRRAVGFECAAAMP